MACGALRRDARRGVAATKEHSSALRLAGHLGSTPAAQGVGRAPPKCAWAPEVTSTAASALQLGEFSARAAAKGLRGGTDSWGLLALADLDAPHPLAQRRRYPVHVVSRALAGR